MKYGIPVILVAVVLLDILDGDFVRPSVLDIVKWVLLVICIVLLIAGGMHNEPKKNQNR
jgi:hypothetical protein